MLQGPCNLQITWPSRKRFSRKFFVLRNFTQLLTNLLSLFRGKRLLAIMRLAKSVRDRFDLLQTRRFPPAQRSQKLQRRLFLGPMKSFASKDAQKLRIEMIRLFDSSRQLLSLNHQRTIAIRCRRYRLSSIDSFQKNQRVTL